MSENSFPSPTNIQEWVKQDIEKIQYLSSVLPINYHKLYVYSKHPF